MSLQKINLQPAELGLPTELPSLSPKPTGKSFSAVLDQFIGDVDGMVKRSGETQRAALEGSVQDIHEIMLAAEEAGIAFELLVELRNKLLEAYRELMRMQV